MQSVFWVLNNVLRVLDDGDGAGFQSHRWLRLACAVPLIICLVIVSTRDGQASTRVATDELAVALALADVLRAARSEIADQQALINSLSDGSKELTGEKVVSLVSARLRAAGRGALLGESTDTRSGRLIQAQFDAIREVIDENQALIDRRDVGFKGFVPAVFARLVNERFEDKVGTDARIKVTAPLQLVRNRKSRPDTWEQSVIDGQFGSPDWPRGDLYAEVTTFKQRNAFRVMVPEYYGQACLACHGGPKGAMDVTGYPMEGGQLDALAGAISIALFQ